MKRLVAGQFLKNEFMKVICIDNSNWEFIVPLIKEGEICTVTGVSPVYSDSYYLREYPIDKIGRPVSFKMRRFIPLSEIDETEMIREYNTVIKT